MPMARGGSSERRDSRTHSSVSSRAGVVSAVGAAVGSAVGYGYASHSRVSLICVLGKSSSGKGIGPSDSVRRQSHG
jgi:hypothetical protein